VGAFAGKREVMEQFDPTRPEPVNHSGTFCAHPVTMVAGLATMELCDQKTIDQGSGPGDRLQRGFNQALRKVGMKGQTTGVGSLVMIHWRKEEISNARDTFIGVQSSLELPKLVAS